MLSAQNRPPPPRDRSLSMLKFKKKKKKKGHSVWAEPKMGWFSVRQLKGFLSLTFKNSFYTKILIYFTIKLSKCVKKMSTKHAKIFNLCLYFQKNGVIWWRRPQATFKGRIWPTGCHLRRPELRICFQWLPIALCHYPSDRGIMLCSCLYQIQLLYYQGFYFKNLNPRKYILVVTLHKNNAISASFVFCWSSGHGFAHTQVSLTTYLQHKHRTSIFVEIYSVRTLLY